MSSSSAIEVVADVLPDRGVRAAARLHRADARRGQRLVPVQELGVLAGEDVVGDHAEPARVAERAAELEEQRRLAAAHGPADADRERARPEVALVRAVALAEGARVGPGVVCVIVGVVVVVGVVVHGGDAVRIRSGAGAVQPVVPSGRLAGHVRSAPLC